MLPWLSLLSVRGRPESRLRHWCSSRYLRISPLHREFRFPLLPSSPEVSADRTRLSLVISQLTFRTAYEPFTPNDSGQRLLLMYYRGCWHIIGRSFLLGYRQGRGVLVLCFSSPRTGLYDPKAFVIHAALLRQGFPHCAKFPTAASRRSLGRVSVPVWPFILSDRLPIVALVSHYLTN